MATYFFRNVGINWGTSTNWSLSDGGGATGAVPTITDTAKFTVNSGPCTVDTSNRVCQVLDFTGYTNTITMTFGITVSGAITLVAAMTISGTGFLSSIVTSILTSNGKTWPNAFTLGGSSQIYTLGDNWTITGLFTTNGTTQITVNSNTIIANGGVAATTVLTGNANLTLGGTGTVTGTLAINTTMNTAGTITLGANVSWRSATYTYTAGTFNPNGFNVNFGASAQNTTVNMSGITFFTVSNSRNILTLTSDLNMSSTWSTGASGSTTTINGAFNVNVGGSLTITSNNQGGIVGTATIVFTGTGTWSQSGVDGLQLNVVINTAGTLTITSTICSSTSFTITAFGTIIWPSSFQLAVTTLTITQSTSWTTLVITNATVTINGGLLLATTLRFSNPGAAIVIQGAFGFTVSNLSFTPSTTVARTYTFTYTNTYTISTSLTINSQSGLFPATLISSDGTNRVPFILSQGASCSVAYVNPTRIDSSAGRTIRSFGATLTDTLNWQTFTDLSTIASTFVN